MVNFLKAFIIFITLNYDGFLQNIKATNNNPFKKETKHVLTLENIQEEKYEINGKIPVCLSSDSTGEEKYVKITEIEYDGIEIQLMDKDYSSINIKESEFHRIMGGDLKPNDRDYYFRIISVIFKVTVFIEEKCFHTTLWYECLSKPIKIYISFYDQLTESFNIHGLNFRYNCITLILPLNCFDNTVYSSSECSENRNIYYVNTSKAGQKPFVLNNLTVNKNSKIYNIDYFTYLILFIRYYILKFIVRQSIME